MTATWERSCVATSSGWQVAHRPKRLKAMTAEMCLQRSIRTPIQLNHCLTLRLLKAQMAKEQLEGQELEAELLMAAVRIVGPWVTIVQFYWAALAAVAAASVVATVALV